MERVDILAIGVHPDDVELGCSGTIAKHVALGHKVGILDLTLGELGTRGSKEIRTKEAMTAAKILKVKFRKQLNLKDGFFENGLKEKIEIIKVLRATKPDIVLCNAPFDRHPDHGRAAQLTKEACFYSGLVKIKTKLKNKEQKPWRPKHVLHYIQDNYIDPTIVVDVTDFMRIKGEAIMAFSSQFYDPKSKEPETPISGQHFFEAVEAKMRLHGRLIGVRYGEGFVASNPLKIDDLTELV
ncbi:MAG: bacillithiol biosynthesis deacetylase BshB1 [Bacteroidia bacterium]